MGIYLVNIKDDDNTSNPATVHDIDRTMNRLDCVVLLREISRGLSMSLTLKQSADILARNFGYPNRIGIREFTGFMREFVAHHAIKREE